MNTLTNKFPSSYEQETPISFMQSIYWHNIDFYNMNEELLSSLSIKLHMYFHKVSLYICTSAAI